LLLDPTVSINDGVLIFIKHTYDEGDLGLTEGTWNTREQSEKSVYDFGREISREETICNT